MSDTNHDEFWANLPACENTEHLLHQSPHICREYFEPPGEPPHHPVPEPSAIALVLVGALAWAGLTRWTR